MHVGPSNFEAAPLWPDSSTALLINTFDVHVWYFKLSAAVGPSALTADERQAAGRYRFDRDRIRYVACRSLLRMLLARYLDTTPAGVRFTYGVQGKPAPDPIHRMPVCFNVSHSADHAVVAIASGREVGIDLEVVRPDFDVEAIVARFFTAAEAKRVFDAPPMERLRTFLQFWTVKEAWMKGVGGGLSLPLERFEVADAAIETGGSLIADPLTGARWTIKPFAPEPQLVGAVAVEGRLDRLRLWQLP